MSATTTANCWASRASRPFAVLQYDRVISAIPTPKIHVRIMFSLRLDPQVASMEKGTSYVLASCLGRLRGRRVWARPREAAIRWAHESDPNGRPRITLRPRGAANPCACPLPRFSRGQHGAGSARNPLRNADCGLPAALSLSKGGFPGFARHDKTWHDSSTTRPSKPCLSSASHQAAALEAHTQPKGRQKSSLSPLHRSMASSSGSICSAVCNG